jgi:RNA polymerase sigma factor (sigma-70 family)
MTRMEEDLARWPLRLRELSQKMRSSPDGPARDQIRQEAWIILAHALRRYLESQEISRASLCPEDIEDLASEKSFDLMRKLESGKWGIADRSGAEIAAFLAATARNGAVDHLRSPKHRHRVGGKAAERAADLPGLTETPREAPDSPLERRAFIEALRDCAGRLSPRSRRIWFFRVFYGLATKEIAAHPGIALKPGHVDVVLSDVRRTVSDCMEAKGQRLRQLPVGSFFEIWKSFREIRFTEVGTNGLPLDASF